MHDGKGIRTIVFLKGCPLACRWCSNPESQQLQPELFYIASKCIMCGLCEKACPQNALSEQNGKIRVDREKCDRCFSCTQVCPTLAIIQKGQEMSVDQVVKEAIKDRVFFDQSGGGVTLSGGEPFYQFEFMLALLKSLKELDINVAVETSGYSSWQNISSALPYIDTFLYDVKHVDSAKHSEFVGVDNEQILTNLKRLIESNANVMVRIPVIPGFNEDTASIEQISERIKNMGIESVELLKFHQYGSSKYTFLDRAYGFEKVHVHEDLEFEGVKAQYRANGLKIL